MFVSVIAAIGRDSRKYKYRVVEGVVIYTLIIAFVHIVSSSDGLGYGEQITESYNVFKNADGTGPRFGTGVYGAVFGGLPLLLTAGNKLAAGIITFLLIFSLVMIFSGTSLLKLVRSLKTPVEVVGDYAEEKLDSMKETYETVSHDVQEIKAKNAEKRRAAREQYEPVKRSRIDIPLDDTESAPDIGIDTIFETSSYKTVAELNNTSLNMNDFDEVKPSKIELLDDYNDSYPENDVEVTEEGAIKADAILEKAVNDLNSKFSDSGNFNFGNELAEPVEQQSEIVEDISDEDEDVDEEEFVAPEIKELEINYELPPIDCLDLPKNRAGYDDSRDLQEKANKIVETLNSFGVGTKIVDICKSPSVTRFELQPNPGVKISKITALADDIAMNLAASGVRIEAPIPNKNAIGIEVPNSEKTMVYLREIVDSQEYKNAKSKLTVALGRDIQGTATCADLAKMPHLLVAGTTGSGKSVCLNAMIISLLYNATPDEVKLIMIDPKKVEFTVYRSIPHLLVPVVSNPRKAAGALSWAVAEMDKRYALFAEKGVRNLAGYNAYAVSENLPKMPQIVIIIDELSDLMMAASNEVEDSICRLAQKARAAGMHLIVATQRPSVDVITGLIKANIPSRIAFAVKSQIDSRTIIDTQGAEKLLGNGDMLYCPVGLSKPVRVQGAYLSDDEIERVINHVTSQGEVKYDDEVIQEIEKNAAKDDKKKSADISIDSTGQGEDGDEMIPKAIEVILEQGMASTTLLQRKLKLGYARAARIIDELSEKGIVGPYEGSKPRKVLITKEQWYEMQARSGSSAPKQLTIEEVTAPKITAPVFEYHDTDDADDDASSDIGNSNYFGGAVSSYQDEE
ncbi:MAG: DNA translocase FtsK [Clostridia bacterium]|nr:DNA translocase FtsK [Clostridia bacterium]